MMPIVPISRPVIVRLLALVLILGLLGLFLLDLELPQEFYELKNAVSSRRKSSSSSKLGPHRLKIHLLPQAFKGINTPQAHSSLGPHLRRQFPIMQPFTVSMSLIISSCTTEHTILSRITAVAFQKEQT